jgi:hypothetical protein
VVLGHAFGCAVRIIRTDDGELVIAPRRTSLRHMRDEEAQ